MKISRDKYELPEAVADSAKELAAILHIREQTIHETRARNRKLGKKQRYIMVEVDE